MQESLSAVRSKVDFDVSAPLPKPNIDTGMGLERVAYLLQGVDNLYEIDEVFPVLDRAAGMAAKNYGASGDPNDGDDIKLRIVADHVRSALMLINDGITPSNEARGYVLRRIIRRSVRSMRLLGVDEAVLPRAAPGQHGGDGPVVPRADRELRAHQRDRLRRGGGVPAHAGRGHHDLRHGRGRDEAHRSHRAGGWRGLQAARHLRVPDRPDPRDGRRAGAARRRARLPAADERAARPGQGRREVAPQQPRRSVRLPLDHGRWSHLVHRLRRGRHRVDGASASCSTVSSSRRRQKAPRSRSSWIARRSTPRAAASSPTRA